MESCDADIRMIMIGKNKSGRTRVAFALGSETRGGNRLFTNDFKHKTFRIRRSPGLISIDKEKEDIVEHLKPGPHVILFAVKNPDEDVELINEYKDMFKNDVLKYTIVILTGKKDLDKRKMSVEKYVQGMRDSAMYRVLSAVKNHVVAINTDDKESHKDFRETVFKMAFEIVEANGSYLALR